MRDTVKQIVLCFALAMLSGCLFWMVWIYGNALRDPRHFDGWVLAGGIVLQLGFHVALKTLQLGPKTASRWRKLHVFLGYALIAAFVSHSGLSLPDTAFGWSLWSAFVLVTLSGLFGTYLAWSVKTRGRVDDRISYDRIPALRAELIEKVRASVSDRPPAADDMILPELPHDAWIMDLYATRLKAFFESPGRFSTHLIGSKQPLMRLISEIDSLSGYLDPPSREKLDLVKGLVIEKDRLEFARVNLELSKAWLIVHVPATYALVVLGVGHILVVYSFSSGTW